MSGKGKGIIGEDIFATMIMMVLIFFFVVSLVDAYSKYLNLQDQIDRERRAAATAEFVFFSNDGIVDVGKINCIDFIPASGRVGFEIKSSAPGLPPPCNLQNRERAVGSMPLIIRSGADLYAGRIIVYVYE